MSSKEVNGLRFRYDDEGRPVQVAGNGWAWDFQYDEQGLMTLTGRAGEAGPAAAEPGPTGDGRANLDGSLCTYLPDRVEGSSRQVTYVYDPDALRRK